MCIDFQEINLNRQVSMEAGTRLVSSRATEVERFNEKISELISRQ